MGHKSHHRPKTARKEKPVGKYYPSLVPVPAEVAKKASHFDLLLNRASEFITDAFRKDNAGKKAEGHRQLEHGLRLGLKAEAGLKSIGIEGQNKLSRTLEQFLAEEKSRHVPLPEFKNVGEKIAFFIKSHEEGKHTARTFFRAFEDIAFKHFGYIVRESHGHYTGSRLRWLAKYRPEEFDYALRQWPGLVQKLKPIGRTNGKTRKISSMSNQNSK